MNSIIEFLKLQNLNVHSYEGVRYLNYEQTENEDILKVEIENSDKEKTFYSQNCW